MLILTLWNCLHLQHFIILTSAASYSQNLTAYKEHQFIYIHRPKRSSTAKFLYKLYTKKLQLFVNLHSNYNIGKIEIFFPNTTLTVLNRAFHLQSVLYNMLLVVDRRFWSVAKFVRQKTFWKVCPPSYHYIHLFHSFNDIQQKYVDVFINFP